MDLLKISNSSKLRCPKFLHTLATDRLRLETCSGHKRNKGGLNAQQTVMHLECLDCFQSRFHRPAPGGPGPLKPIFLPGSCHSTFVSTGLWIHSYLSVFQPFCPWPHRSLCQESSLFPLSLSLFQCVYPALS